MTKPQGERRTFRAHPKLLLDVIQRQAGTPSKAILEGIMNAGDAQATKVEITVTRDEIRIVDNGVGFASRDTITTFFEEFGHPHDEAEGKIYGTFRMGRGQLFAFGANTWRTGQYVMEVDIKTMGLEYQLKDAPTPHPGCSIEIALYEPLMPSSRMDIERDIALWAKYAPLEVYYNGQLVSTDPKNEKWDHETEDAYIRLHRGPSVSVYNLGIHVTDLPSYKFGTGGVVVSKQQLTVNFARNDIQSTCPVWRRINPFLQAEALKEIKKRPSLDEAGRQRLVDRILRGEATAEEAQRANVVTLVHGRHVNLSRLYGEVRFTVAPMGDRIGDKLHESGTVFVLGDDTLRRFRVSSGYAFLETLGRLDANARPRGKLPEYVPFDLLASAYDESFTILSDKDLKPRERAWVDLINRHDMTLARLRVGDRERQAPRQVVIGEAETADGWTDGTTYVAINRAWLAEQKFDLEGITNVALLLVHEFTHEAATHEGCDHEMTFYENYHANVQERLAFVISKMLADAPTVLAKHKRRLTRSEARSHDRAERAEVRDNDLPADDAESE